MKAFKTFSVSIMLLGFVLMAACKKDEDPGVSPTVISTDPIDKAANTPINSKISATFSVAMDSSTITNTKFTVKQGTTAVAGTVKYTNMVATFTPTGNLAPNVPFTATISAGIKAMSGTSLEKDFSWTFTSGAIPDVTVPTIVSTEPLNSALLVAINGAVSVTFSEAMGASTINSTTFSLKEGANVVAGAVTYAGIKATFTPTTPLAYSKVYTAGITTGAKDVAGNAVAASSFSFTTTVAPDVTAPVVNSTDPIGNATGVARNKVVSVVFSEAMTASTISATSFTLMQGTTAVAGVVAYAGNTATFASTNQLAVNAVYTATVTTAAKDLAGNALAANRVWTFTTGGTLSTLAVVDLGAAANYVILAKTAITNISTSAVTGDLGLSPAATSYITGLSLTDATGFATSAQVTGKLYAADMAAPTPINLTTAVNNMITAYNDAAGRPSPDFLELATGSIGGKTLTAGLYKWTNSVSMSSDVVISGSATDVWIFQISGDLSMAPAVKITLTGGALAKNIFWQVAGQATLGTTTSFSGVLLSMTGITLQTGASFNGRALAQTAVVLDGNAVTKPN